MNSESTVIVTGASGDIGLSIIERLIADGLKVAACCRSNPEKVARAFGSDVEIHELDLRDEASIKTCASTIIRCQIGLGPGQLCRHRHGWTVCHDPNDGYARRF